MMDLIDDFPAPDLPMSSTLRCFWRLERSELLILLDSAVSAELRPPRNARLFLRWTLMAADER